MNTLVISTKLPIYNSRYILESIFIMAEFASKGVAGSGLGLGIAGMALGVLNSSANGNGLLGGLFGGGN